MRYVGIPGKAFFIQKDMESSEIDGKSYHKGKEPGFGSKMIGTRSRCTLDVKFERLGPG
jgi:hypothetical protein